MVGHNSLYEKHTKTFFPKYFVGKNKLFVKNLAPKRLAFHLGIITKRYYLYSIISVSYTHLDVYKRQVCVCVCASF